MAKLPKKPKSNSLAVWQKYEQKLKDIEAVKAIKTRTEIKRAKL